MEDHIPGCLGNGTGEWFGGPCLGLWFQSGRSGCGGCKTVGGAGSGDPHLWFWVYLYILENDFMISNQIEICQNFLFLFLIKGAWGYHTRISSLLPRGWVPGIKLRACNSLSFTCSALSPAQATRLVFCLYINYVLLSFFSKTCLRA